MTSDPHSHNNTIKKPPLNRIPQTNKYNFLKGLSILHEDVGRKKKGGKLMS